MLLLIGLGLNFQSFAQDGYKAIFVRGGIGYKSSTNLAIGVDFSSSYYSSYELSANYFKRNDDSNYENFLLGVNYKPLIFREKNTLMKFRFGVYGGSDGSDFIFAPNFGLEFAQSLSPKTELIFTNDNNYFFEAKNNNNWRTNLQVGFRLIF